MTKVQETATTPGDRAQKEFGGQEEAARGRRGTSQLQHRVKAP